MKHSQAGHSLTVYLSNREYEMLRLVCEEQQGTAPTHQQVMLFARQWAKAGTRIPIRERLEKELFKVRREVPEK